MLMRVVQAQVTEALEDEVQVVDMVPILAQPQQRGRWAPTAMVTRAHARQQQQQQQQQQQMMSRSQKPVATAEDTQASGSPPQTDRE